MPRSSSCPNHRGAGGRSHRRPPSWLGGGGGWEGGVGKGSESPPEEQGRRSREWGSSGISGCIRQRSGWGGAGGTGRQAAPPLPAGPRRPGVPGGSRAATAGWGCGFVVRVWGFFLLGWGFLGAAGWLSPYCQLAGVEVQKKKKNLEKNPKQNAAGPRRGVGSGGALCSSRPLQAPRPRAAPGREPGPPLQGTGEKGCAHLLERCL